MKWFQFVRSFFLSEMKETGSILKMWVTEEISLQQIPRHVMSRHKKQLRNALRPVLKTKLCSETVVDHPMLGKIQFHDLDTIDTMYAGRDDTSRPRRQGNVITLARRGGVAQRRGAAARRSGHRIILKNRNPGSNSARVCGFLMQHGNDVVNVNLICIFFVI
jgi:hypothetical protein